MPLALKTVKNIDNNEQLSQPLINTAGIPLLSFFTGAGFLDIGFMQAGFNTIWRNEYNKYFVQGFEHGLSTMLGPNHDYKVHNTNSIIDVGPNQIAKEAFNNALKPDVFGIIGGPPCPDFSVGGKNRGREGDNGKLSQVYVHRIIELQPTFFLFENVPGLLRTAKHRVFFNHLVEQLKVYYHIDFRILNALDIGVPQDRERVFFLGVHRKWMHKMYGVKMTANIKDWFPWPYDARYAGAKNRFNWPDQCPFGNEPEMPEGIPKELMVGPLICNTEELSLLPNGNEAFRPTSEKFFTIPEGAVSRKSFKRLHRWRYSPTAAYGNNEVHLHPMLPRRLTVREALRIQTVPDTYVLPPEMPLSHKFKTIGNGVPVKLAYAVGQAFMKVLGGELDGTF